MNSMLGQNYIKNGDNLTKLVDNQENDQIFKNQQFIMEYALHTCDLSPTTRSFDLMKKWTYYLFDEFFDQGDIEKDKGLTVSMLCDRETTSVCGS